MFSRTKHTRLGTVLIAPAVLVLLSGTALAQARSGRPTLQETLWGALTGGLIGLVIAIILIVAGKASKRRKKERNPTSPTAEKQQESPPEEQEKHE
jgi:uncharacterized membrane protein